MSTRFSRFGRDEDGNVVIMFGLSLFTIIGTIGGAVDVGRSITAFTAMQDVADYTALNLAATAANDVRDGTSFTSSATTNLQAQALSVAQTRAAELGASNVTVRANWATASDKSLTLTVTAQTTYSSIFLSAVPGLPTSFTISGSATARSYQQNATETAAKPSKVDLSYEAADYNQVWVYCYDKNWATTNYGNGKSARTSDEGTAKATMSGNLSFTKQMATNMNTKGRADFTLIADNGGSLLTFSMPTCATNETISYALYNSRNNRTTPSNWSKNYTSCGTSLSQTGKTCYQWYTDTLRSDSGVESYATSPYQLETILCDDANCNTTTGGGVNGPNADYHLTTRQTNRAPIQATGCQAGKYMYFGWEDRPPQNQGGNGTGAPYADGVSDPGGDRDYDDIRIIVNCPQYSYTPGARSVSLVK